MVHAVAFRSGIGSVRYILTTTCKYTDFSVTLCRLALIFEKNVFLLCKDAQNSDKIPILVDEFCVEEVSGEAYVVFMQMVASVWRPQGSGPIAAFY